MPISMRRITGKLIMRQKIKGKLYDTAASLLIWRYHEGEGRKRVQESLYKDKDGSFFLYARGGSLSRYAFSPNNKAPKGREFILPMTDRKAIDWIIAHVDCGVSKKKSLSIDGRLYMELKILALSEGMNPNRLVEKLIRQEIHRDKTSKQ